MRLEQLLADALDGGERSVRELLAVIRAAGGAGVSRGAVERALAASSRFERVGDPAKARWRLADAQPTDTDDRGEVAVARAGAAEVLGDLELRPWQAEALAAWSSTCRGVVEAVTGTGKTRLAMAAMRVVLRRAGRALVLVPTLELQEQWVRELRAVLPDTRVGRMGGGRDDDLFSHEVVVATPHSASAVPVDLPPGAVGLLVADEAHRYGAPTWGAALHEVFGMRLALTATYERGDDGLSDVLEPYFGDVVYRYRYDRAVPDGAVAPFSIGFVGIDLTPGERDAYDALDARVRQVHRELVGGLGMPKEPRALLAAVAAVVADAGPASIDDGPQVRACREYLVKVRERRDVAAGAAAKIDVCRAAAGGLRSARALVFSDTVDQAEAAATALRGRGVEARTLHGDLAKDERRIRMALFRRGDVSALVAPRVLDEGVDVPDADVAIVLAAFRTRRQMIQRLGRVLRLKADGRGARLVIVYARDTAEDPGRGGHQSFLGEVRDVASEIRDVPAARLDRWLVGEVARTQDGAG